MALLDVSYVKQIKKQTITSSSRTPSQCWYGKNMKVLLAWSINSLGILLWSLIRDFTLGRSLMTSFFSSKIISSDSTLEPINIQITVVNSYLSNWFNHCSWKRNYWNPSSLQLLSDPMDERGFCSKKFHASIIIPWYRAPTIVFVSHFGPCIQIQIL